MVPYVYAPRWFFGIDSLFEIVSVITGLLIAYFGYKTYKFTKQKRYLYFSASFFLVAMAFLANIFSYLVFYTRELKKQIIGLTSINVYVLKEIVWVSEWAAFASIFLMLAAFLLLVIISFKIKHRIVNFLLFYFIIVATLYSKHSFIFFHATLAVLLGSLVVHYYNNYKLRKIISRKLVVISFLIIFLSQIFFMASAFNAILFVLAQIIQLTGYLVLLITLILVLKK